MKAKHNVNVWWSTDKVSMEKPVEPGGHLPILGEGKTVKERCPPYAHPPLGSRFASFFIWAIAHTNTGTPVDEIHPTFNRNYGMSVCLAIFQTITRTMLMHTACLTIAECQTYRTKAKYC